MAYASYSQVPNGGVTLADYQWEIAGLVMGANTPYLVSAWGGAGIPEIKQQDLPRPDRRGAFFGKEYPSAVAVLMTVNIVGGTPANTTALRDALTKAWRYTPLNQTDTSSIQPLRYKLPGQSVRSIFGRPRRMAPKWEQLVYSFVPVDLEYQNNAGVEYADSTSGVSMRLGAAGGGGLTFPTTTPFYFGATSTPTTAIANSQGTADTYPVVTINGSVTRPRVTNNTTGDYIELNLTLGASDQVVLDFDAHTVTLNGSSRYATLTQGSTWWTIPPGQTELRFSAYSYSSTASATFVWRDAWF